MFKILILDLAIIGIKLYSGKETFISWLPCTSLVTQNTNRFCFSIKSAFVQLAPHEGQIPMTEPMNRVHGIISIRGRPGYS